MNRSILTLRGFHGKGGRCDGQCLLSRRERPHREGHIHHQEPEVEPVTNRTEGRFGPVTATLAVVNGLLFSDLATSSCDPSNLSSQRDDLR